MNVGESQRHNLIHFAADNEMDGPYPKRHQDTKVKIEVATTFERKRHDEDYDNRFGLAKSAFQVPGVGERVKAVLAHVTQAQGRVELLRQARGMLGRYGGLR